MDLVARLRARLITVPKPGTVPRILVPGECITVSFGGARVAGEDAGEQFLSSVSGLVSTGSKVQRHVYAVEPLCEEAAQEIERLRKALQDITDEWELGDAIRIAKDALKRSAVSASEHP